ncbi:MAG: S8 family peptidase, partial [Anaerolineae bacterium]
PPGIELKLESLEDRGKGIELVAVQRFQPDPERPPVQRATVFVPDGALKHFFTKFEQYATEQTKKGEPRHKELVDRIAELRRATLRALWTDEAAAYPAEGEAIWWEVWLRRHDGRELARLHEFAQAVGLSLGERRLAFDDRIVVLVRGTAQQLSGSLDVLNDVAEVRRAKESAAFFADMPAEEQAAWIKDLLGRTTPPPKDAPAVCILDTGVTRAHPLLELGIAPSDATAVDPAWGPHDDGGGLRNMGHGTEMAGLALYGDLVAVLTARDPVRLSHRIESVKILPPHGVNHPELYGAVTAQAVARPEVSAPDRRRVFALAVTTLDGRDRGQPTSWSAALDALAAGRVFDPATQGLCYLSGPEEAIPRLFVVSAGNVPLDQLGVAHLERSDVEAVHDPAQAWNVLTVGAYTEKAVITHPDWSDWSPVSPPGELSPWSTTSVTFQDIWPIKPEVVFEGGNVAYSGNNLDYPIPDLCVLSTYYKPSVRPLVLSYATSAATAQVARMAAIIRAEYPEFWPETVRAL